MSLAELDNLAAIGSLKRQPPSAEEIAALVSSARARCEIGSRREPTSSKVRPEPHLGHLAVIGAPLSDDWGAAEAWRCYIPTE
jgi:hypothetical protein